MDLRQWASIHCTLANLLMTLSPARIYLIFSFEVFVSSIFKIVLARRTRTLCGLVTIGEYSYKKVGECLLDIHQCGNVFSPIGESSPYFRQCRDDIFANWRMSAIRLPKYLVTFAIDDCPVGESLVGEIRNPLCVGLVSSFAMVQVVPTRVLRLKSMFVAVLCRFLLVVFLRTNLVSRTCSYCPLDG